MTAQDGLMETSGVLSIAVASQGAGLAQAAVGTLIVQWPLLTSRQFSEPSMGSFVGKSLVNKQHRRELEQVNGRGVADGRPHVPRLTPQVILKHIY